MARVAAGIGWLLLAGMGTAMASPVIEFENSGARQAFEARVVALNAALLASDSATLTLEAWCRDNGMAVPAHIVVDRDAGGVRAPSPEQRARLRVGTDEPVRYRHVRLRCGTHILSEAENWYVPARLTPAMNAALDETDISFGRVIRPLAPRRDTFTTTRGWDGAADGLSCGATLFTHGAIVLSADGQPLAEVREHYKAELFC